MPSTGERIDYGTLCIPARSVEGWLLRCGTLTLICLHRVWDRKETFMEIRERGMSGDRTVSVNWWLRLFNFVQNYQAGMVSNGTSPRVTHVFPYDQTWRVLQPTHYSNTKTVSVSQQWKASTAISISLGLTPDSSHGTPFCFTILC